MPIDVTRTVEPVGKSRCKVGAVVPVDARVGGPDLRQKKILESAG